MARPLSWPLAFIYGQAIGVRNRMFQSGLRKTQRLGFPVISVGNITVGGTGKTPCILMLGEHFLSLGKKVAVVSRGYGRKTTGDAEVTIGEQAPILFGDEPVLIKSRLPDARVFVGKDRGRLLQGVASTFVPEVALADDAYQHRQLYRDLDILIMDAVAPLEDYKLLPQGKLREPLEQISRADLIIISKTNLVSAQKVKELQVMIDGYKSSGTQVFHSELRILSVKDLLGNTSTPGSCLLVSGVGRPEAVMTSVEKLLKVHSHQAYPDHHSYSKADAENILQLYTKSGAEVILTTSKDAVKLQAFSELRPYLRIADAEMRITEEQAFYERIDQIFT